MVMVTGIEAVGVFYGVGYCFRNQVISLDSTTTISGVEYYFWSQISFLHIVSA